MPKATKDCRLGPIGTPHTVTMDFLIPPGDESDEGGAIPHIESDLAAKVTLGLELAFKDRCWKRLSGSTPAGAWVTRIIPLCSLGAFTVLKAHLGTAQRTKMPMTSSTVGSRLFTCG